jgi:hypothetical protein
MPGGKKNRKKKKPAAEESAVAEDQSNPLYYKTQGNTAFAAGDYALAVTQYSLVSPIKLHLMKSPR